MGREKFREDWDAGIFSFIELDFEREVEAVNSWEGGVVRAWVEL